ncbi:alpha/beta fold hydrolase [Christiangramia salexigens]|uniref:Alpha/beta hydrolase n=1 Tax=Christiangramia salexigens TaxID=1913577 RepID=A0A1L3J742_9FLAO|nr:alpha/beta hydrolase [Christiangramia salexigens]APG60930.1 alpha/beta hydrolase [Christiangramia salexigens]
MDNIKFKGANIYFEVTGEGHKTPLVLLHGFLEDLSIWRNIIPELADTRQIISIDLPGHGKSEAYGDVHNMGDMAEVVRDVLEELGLEKISIAGHSMGGYVGLEFLNKFPMLLESIMLINSTPQNDSAERIRIRERSVELVHQNKEAYLSMAIGNLFTKENRKRFSKEIEELKTRANEMSAESISAALTGMKIRTNLSYNLKKFDGQKMVLGGRLDPILDFSELKSLCRDIQAEFYALENGHMAYLEDVKKLTKIMHFID